MERSTGHPAQHQRAPRTVRVAVAGCGAVGGEFVREVEAQRESLARRHGVAIELRAVLVRDVLRSRAVRLRAGVLTSDVERFAATDVDVLVEAIGGIDPAHGLVDAALRRGIAVVTANKALMAAHGTSLLALAERCGTTLRYDAAVGGGVPVLRLIDDALGAGTPRSIRGIFNGTSNFVQSCLERGSSLDKALATAQALGFAEADAARDLDGRDAADKLALVAWAAYGVAPDTLAVRRQSLLPDPARYTALADRLGCAVRQIAECAVVDGAVRASVQPVLVRRDSAFACTRDEQNRVEVHSGWSAPLCASGPGAGGLPTATALLSDLLCTRQTTHRMAGGRTLALDPRKFAWAVEAACAPADMHRLSAARGPVRTNAAASLCWMLVENATADEVGRIVTTLAAAGASPIAARFDDDVRANECDA